ncbi:MAG: imidazole glycerol phosphate synthase subunit HisH [Myxococcota bacterium]
MRPALGIVDYGSGNFGSVWNAGLRLGLSQVAIRGPQDVKRCSHIVLPGVGAFGAAMDRLATSELDRLVIDEARAGRRPILGICVGMQILADLGCEFGSHPGLGLITGTVERIQVPSTMPLPHMGWNSVEMQGDSPLFDGIDGEPALYFVHSYHLVPTDPAVIAATATYGHPIVAAVSQGSLHGVQFHPEKSQEHGLQLLHNFVTLRV